MGLAQAGVDVEVWTTNRGYLASVDDPADARLKAGGVRLRYFPAHPRSWLGQRYAFSPSLGAALPAKVREVDLVHISAMWLYPTAAASRTCRKQGRPYIISPCGGLDPYGLRVRSSLKFVYGYCIERRNLAGAAAVHFTSPMEQKNAFLFGASPRGVVIPRSIRPEEIPSSSPGVFRKRHPEVGDRKILLFLGRLHAKKRPDLAAEAFALAARKRPDLHLVMAGPEEGMSGKVKHILSSNNLLERATFTGLLSGADKWAAFQDSTAFLLPSEDENFGMAALEAMTCGVPVLLSRNVGLSDAVSRAGAGIVLDEKPEAWAQAIERLLEEPATCSALGTAGRRLSREEFSSQAVAEGMREAYLKAVSGTRRRP